MKLNDQIDKSISQGKKVVVFTQSVPTVRSFLYDHPGKWTVKFDHKLWPRDVAIHDKPGKISQPLGNEIPQIGVDACSSDILFTCQPSITIPPNYVVIQGNFRSPIVRLREREVLDKIYQPDAVFTDSVEHYRVRRHLTNKPPVAVFDKFRYVTGENIVVRMRTTRISTDDLACFHSVQNVWVDSDVVWDDIPSFNQCSAVIEAIGLLGESATTSGVNADWVTRHVVCNPLVVPKALEFLREAGVLKAFNMDESTITIAEPGKQAIAMTYLEAWSKYGKDFMLEFKKKEEDKELMFGYHCSIKRYYVAVNQLSRELYNQAVRKAKAESSKWYQIVENSKWVNSRLHENVRRMYLSHEVYMLDDENECHLVGETGRVSI